MVGHLKVAYLSVDDAVHDTPCLHTDHVRSVEPPMDEDTEGELIDGKQHRVYDALPNITFLAVHEQYQHPTTKPERIHYRQ